MAGQQKEIKHARPAASASPRAARRFSRLRSSALALLVLLVLSSPLFAATFQAWQGSVIAAILIALMVAVFAYMLVYALHIEALKAVVREEFFQVGLVALLAILLVIALPWIDGLTHHFVCGITDVSACPKALVDSSGHVLADNDITNVYSFCSTADPAGPGAGRACPATAPLSAWALAVNQNQQATLSHFIQTITGYSNALGEVGSRSGFCSMLGVGFGVAGCTAFSALRGPVGQLINAAGMGLMDLQAENLLLRLDASATLSLLLPLGLLLRALHFSRKVGATLIAMALALYIVFPATLLLSQSMADRFILETVRAPGSTHVWAALPVPDASSLSCDPFAPEEGVLAGALSGLLTSHYNGQDSQGHPACVDASNKVIDDLLYCPSPADQILFFALARTLLSTVLALTVSLAFIRVLGQALGAEIDVSALARLS